MVARSLPKDASHVFDKMSDQSLLVKETVKKVDRAMARLQDLQSTIRGYKVRSRVILSPRSSGGYMRASLRCKQESLRVQESTKRISGGGNGAEDKKCGQQLDSAEIHSNIAPGEWRRWSLPAALVQQAVGEILEASNFAKDVVNIVSDSISNKLMQDPQISFNGAALLEEWRKKDVQVDWNIKATQSTLKTPLGRRQSLISYLQEEGLDGKYFLDGIDRLEPGNEDKKSANSKSQKVVHKFRMVTPEQKVKALSSKAASSSLELHRKTEKQQLHERARSELSHAGERVRSQMNFRSSNCANECGKNVKALASALVSCCTSPARSIGEEKPLVKVDRIIPVQKPWISHPKPTMAIMFPNPAFVPSPSDSQNNSRKICQKTRCMTSGMSTSVERKSLSYVKGFDSAKLKQSFLSKENVSIGKMNTRKPSSHLNSPKVKTHYSLPKVSIRTPMKTPARMSKQAPLVKSSAASNPVRSTAVSYVNLETPPKFSKFFSPSKNKNSKHSSSSKKPVWFHRNNIALHSDSSPVTCNISRLSKKLIHSPVQPLPSLISKLPSRRKRNSSPVPNLKKKAEPYPAKEGVTNKTVETQGSAPGRVLPLPPAWGTTMAVAAFKDAEMPCKSSVHDHVRSMSCPKQRPRKPIENITNFSSIDNRISNFNAAEAEISIRRKDQQSEGKENKIDSEEEGHDEILKKPNRVLRRSCSFGHENTALLSNGKLNSMGGGLPFLKYVRGFINMQRTANNINR